MGNSKDTKYSVNNTLDHSDNVDDEDYGLEIIEFERQDTGAAHSQPRGSVRRAHREHERSSSGNARMKNSISQMQLEREKAAHRKRIKKFIPFALAAVLGTAALVIGLNLHMKKRTVTDKTAPADASVSSEASEELAALEQAGSDKSAEQAAISDSTVSAETSAVEDSLSAASVSSRASSAFNGMETDRTCSFGDNIISSYGIILDADTMEILGKRSPYTKMYPASMTKVMTLLVAVDNISEEQLDDTFEITREITDYTYSHECSAVGFDVGEKVKVRDLLYGLILPSGGDAALALAQYVAGSQEDFVRMMNDKLAELNLESTAHFTNCIGLYDDEHYCTAYDMAVIMRAAIENDRCREIMSTKHYVTEGNDIHTEGIDISNWFLRRIEDRDSGGNIICGKTGFVVQSRNCAVSYGEGPSGQRYICCTGFSTSAWQCIDDQAAIYKKYFENDDSANGSSGSSQGTENDSDGAALAKDSSALTDSSDTGNEAEDTSD